MEQTLSHTRLYADSAGESHFADFSITLFDRSFAPPAPPFYVSEFGPATQHAFLQVPGGWIGELHPSPIRMWIFLLAGEMAFEASDGEVRRVGAGSALLLEDTTGKGHQSRVLGEAPATLAVVQLGD